MLPNTKPRIILVQNHLAEKGGLSAFADLLSRGLSARGYQVEIGGITPATGSTHRAFSTLVHTWTLVEDTIPVNNRTWPRHLANYRTARNRSQFDRKVRKAAQQRFNSYKQDTIIITLQIYAYRVLSNFVADRTGPKPFPVVAMYHGSFQAAEAGPDLLMILATYKDSDAFVCLSEGDAEQFAVAGLSGASFISNPVDIPEETEVSRLDNKVLVSLSRYDRVKQVDHMIRAVAALPAEAHGWQLHLYGYGPEEVSLRELIDELGVGDRVHLMGWADDPGEALTLSSISLNTSQFEGFGLAIVEAAARGVPTVAYASSWGVREAIKDGVTGILVPPNDQERFHSALCSLISDRGRLTALGTSARTHAVEQFSLNRITEEWEELFSSLLAKRQQPRPQPRTERRRKT